MKNVVFLLVALLITTNVGWGVWAFRLRSNSVASVLSPPTNSSAHAPHPPPSNVSMVHNWQDYQATQIKVLQDHPELAAEFKAIQNEIADQRAKLNAATIEADPNVAPILAKLDLMRQHSLPPGPPVSHPVPGPPGH